MARSGGKKSKQNPKEAIMEKTIHNKEDDGGKENSTLAKETDSDQKRTALEDLPEYIYIDMDALDYYLKCLLCLDTLTEVRAVKACNHRFCKECIDKSIRSGNRGCPLCRAPCSSLRATTEDATLNGFLSHVVPYMDKEDYKLSEEDKLRNEKLQASFSAIASRQQDSKRKRNSRRDA